MLQNPFFIRSVEKIETVPSFLSLFNHKMIEFIKQDDLKKTLIFRSTPGGGKSTIFRLFRPDVLNGLIASKAENKECYAFLNQLSVVGDDKPKVLGILISCARNYSIIEDIYENGKRLQVFFSLLNLRIIREALENILRLTNNGLEFLSQITFKKIPTELAPLIDYKWTGKEIYDWAREEENTLWSAVDDMNDSFSSPFAHNALSALDLIEASNILFNHENFVEQTLILFDDVHALTKQQQMDLKKCVFQMRPQIGVWMAERCSALTDYEVLGSDGRVGREYEERLLEKLTSETKSTFYKALLDIADRRIRSVRSDALRNFEACLSNELVIDAKLDAIIQKSIKKLSVFIAENDELILEHMSDFSMPGLKTNQANYEKAVILRAIKILIDRKLSNNQMFFRMQPMITKEDVLKQLDGLRSAAELYLCVENQIPFYFGMGKICELSFNNVDQFLSFSGAVFERKLALEFATKKNKKFIVEPREQEEVINKENERKWNEISTQYVNAKEMQSLLNNICTIGIISREKGLASYSGGAFTGVGVKKGDLEDMLNITNKSKYATLIQALSNCVTANLLSIEEITQNGDICKVFYLNRWLCAYKKLPLQYGGWKRLNLSTMNNLISKSENSELTQIATNEKLEV